jgi:hypothetical protein
MNKKHLSVKPIESAQRLRLFLRDLPNQTTLTPVQNVALNQDIQKIENLIVILMEADSAEDWKSIWTLNKEIQHSLGGYVGDELGKQLSMQLEQLWKDIFDSYSEGIHSP